MRLGLQRKITLSIVSAGAIPLCLGLLFAYSQSTAELEAVIGANFRALAGETAHSLDLMMNGEILRRTRLASNEAVVTALAARNARYRGRSPDRIDALLAHEAAQWDAATPETPRVAPSASSPTAVAALEVLQRFAKTQGYDDDPSDAGPLRAIFVTDREGAVLLNVSTGGLPAYRQADARPSAAPPPGGKDRLGRTSLSTVFFDDRFNAYVFTLAVPIRDPANASVLGWLHSVYDAKEFFRPATQPVRFGKTGHVMLIDSRGTVIVCPILPTGTRVSDATLVESVTGPQAGWVKAAGDGHGGRDVSIIGFSPLQDTSLVTKASTGLLWHSFAWQASEEIFAPTRSLLGWIAAAGLVAIGLLGAIGYFAAHRIVVPIQALQDHAARIGQGELTEPIVIRTGDEIERLADEFNAMNRRLASAFAGLEDQVAAKTSEVRFLKEYNEKILNSLPESVVIAKPDRTVEYVNAEALRALEVPREAWLGRDFFDVVRIEPAARDPVVRDFEQVLAGTNEPAAPAVRPPEQASRDPLAPHLSDLPDAVSSVLQDIRIGGRSFRRRLFRVNAGLNGDSRVGIALRDVTSERHLQDQLIRAEKLAGMGTLTAGIAHEVNNPLFVIMGLAQTLEDETDAAVARAYAKDIVKHCRHMASVIKNFARYSSPGAAESGQAVDVQQALEDALKLARMTQVSDDIEIVTRYHPVPRILAKPEEVQQVFMNLIVNAFQAMGGHGMLRLAIDRDGGCVRVRIADNGPGIPKAFVGKIFDPFFTTKEPGKGTGLGLSIVYQILSKYGGTIGVETHEGRGTEFTIAWPEAPV